MESKKSPTLTKYQKRLKRLLDKNVIDIILFGSFVRQGLSNDIDIALVVKEKKDFSEIKKEIYKIIEKADIQIIDIYSLYSNIWTTLIKEGFSVNKNKFLFEIYKIKPSVLYKYSLKKLTNVQKVQFERGIKQVLGDKGVFLTRSVVMIPMYMKNGMTDFLKTWKIYYESQEYELLPRLRKETFL
ncbi:nucleotidyltransferase domain-containing protein [Nanoarchaeota archaeon]